MRPGAVRAIGQPHDDIQKFPPRCCLARSSGANTVHVLAVTIASLVPVNSSP